MEAIKKKMQAMKEEQDKAEDKADAKEAIFKVADTRLKKVEAEVALLQQALTDLETEFESEKKVLYVANQTFYKKERQVQRTEMDHGNRCRVMYELEEKLEDVTANLETTSTKLTATLKTWDECDRLCKVMKSYAESDGAKMKQMEIELKDVTIHVETTEKKIDETVKKQAFVEEEIETWEERASNAELKSSGLMEEVQVVGNNMRSLEHSQEMSRQAEKEFKAVISTLNARLKKTEARAAFAERSCMKLQREVDKLDDELAREKDKVKNLTIEMETTIADLK